MTLNMFHGTNTLLPLSSKGYEMDRYEKVTQKRSIPENYQVTAIEWWTCYHFVNDCIKLKEVGKNFSDVWKCLPKTLTSAWDHEIMF